MTKLIPPTDIIIMDDPLAVISEKDMEEHRKKAHNWYDKVLKANPDARISNIPHNESNNNV